MQANTIRKQLLTNYGKILVIVILLAVVSLTAMMRERAGKAETNKAIEFSQLTQDLRRHMLENRLSLSNYLLSGDPREAEALKTGLSEVNDLMQKAQVKVLDGEQRATMNKLQAHEADWGKNFAEVMVQKRKEVDSGNTTVSDLQIAYLQLDPATWMKNANQVLDEVEKQTMQRVAERRDWDNTASLISIIVTILGSLIGLTFGVVIAFRNAREITEPLAHLTSVAREIAESGDLDQKIDINREDEIGELAETFRHLVAYLKEMSALSDAIAGGDLTAEAAPRSNRDTLALSFAKMTSGLRSIVTAVRDAAAQVAAGSNQVADSSEESAKISVQSSSAIDEVTSTMHEMSINVQNMVKNTQMQSSSVSETSASIDEMVASIQRVADTAKVLLDISNRSREEVQIGIGTMQKTTDGLSRINSSIGSAAGIIAELGKRADDIGKIIEVIDDISEQTNLLALNAAIEAARAGEHGLGFAVVADEVRKLAEKSASSTKEISELIQSIQKEARKAVDNMDKSTTIVNEGLSLGTDLSLALKKISNVVTEVYKFAQEIGAATNEQSHGSSQIAKATTRLNEITHEINSSVEEQAGGAQAVVRAMERMREMIQQSTSGSTELAASAEQMSKMARSMLESMDRFTLDERAARAAEQPRVTGVKYALAGRS
ncbi:MAG TPA: methyl-accepting chemotaxis protein [Clostridia bacterium]|nr:methyl-accepting chemotaxis protein [Clostridia bacterium]